MKQIIHTIKQEFPFSSSKNHTATCHRSPAPYWKSSCKGRALLKAAALIGPEVRRRLQEAEQYRGEHWPIIDSPANDAGTRINIGPCHRERHIPARRVEVVCGVFMQDTGDESWIYACDLESKTTVYGVDLLLVATLLLENCKTVNSEWYTVTYLPEVFEEIRNTADKAQS
ncbi:hypothetical protein EVAR_49174_1 [Eumeta japonica]|uniref:Uncharacterized protein n=1 Tax=Eumeta variegata TaxID=151549 RepID=A0A4C1YH04_EUMVA|nr:hypothetical protein EVAR_49174_1 [Eumeta japonica]